MKFLILLSLVFIHFSNAQAKPYTDIALQKALLDNTRADAMVYFPESFSLEKSRKITDRVQRLRYVYKGLVETSTRAQTSLIEYLNSQQISFRSFYIENALVIYGMNAELLAKLEKRSDISAIRLDVKASLDLPEQKKNRVFPNGETPDFISQIGVDRVWNELGIKGNGIVVANQDSGINWEHRALKNKYRGFHSMGAATHDYNWHDAIRATNSPTPIDDIGHGTHTMGTMVGHDGGEYKIGVAPGAKWIACRNMNNDVGSVSSYLECFEFFLAPYKFNGTPKVDGRPELAPHIVNNSWTCPPKEGCNGGELLQAVRALRAAGIFVVAAGGNGGPGCGSMVKAPGMYAGDIFSVGSYNQFYKDISPFSSWGPSAFNGGLAPNLVAPGENVLSSFVGGRDKYEYKDGTSMASPQVAGTVALLWSARPELIGQIERTIEILQKSATPMLAKESCAGFPANEVPNATFGYGLLNAYNAIKTP